MDICNLSHCKPETRMILPYLYEQVLHRTAAAGRAQRFKISLMSPYERFEDERGASDHGQGEHKNEVESGTLKHEAQIRSKNFCCDPAGPPDAVFSTSENPVFRVVCTCLLQSQMILNSFTHQDAQLTPVPPQNKLTDVRKQKLGSAIRTMIGASYIKRFKKRCF